MNRIGVLLLGLSLSLSACSPSTVAPRAAISTTTPFPTRVPVEPAHIAAVARAALPDWLQGARGDYAGFGFKDPSELDVATIGTPYEVYELTPQAIKAYTEGQRVADIVRPSQAWEIPVLVDGEARGMLTVAYHEGRWQAAGFGGGNTPYSQNVVNLEKELAGTGASVKLLVTYPLQAHIALIERNGRESLYYLDPSGLFPALDVKALRQVPPSELFPELAMALASYGAGGAPVSPDPPPDGAEPTEPPPDAGVPPQSITPLPHDDSPPMVGMPPDMAEFLRQSSPAELAKHADLIVLGVTDREQLTGRLAPDSPLIPPDPPGHPPQEPPLYTETRVNVERVLKGAPPAGGLRVRTLGGEVDGQATVMTHQPQLGVNRRVVLFLKQVEPGYYTPLGEDGVYEIVGEEAIGPRHRFPLSELLLQITSQARATVGPVPEARPAVVTPAIPPTEILPSVHNDPAVIQLLAELRAHGVDPAPAHVSRDEVLNDAPGQAYRLGSGWLTVHLYPNAKAAGEKRRAVSDYLANPIADWVAPPHAYRCESMIVVYFGTDVQVTTALTDLCGAQFAGVS